MVGTVEELGTSMDLKLKGFYLCHTGAGIMTRYAPLKLKLMKVSFAKRKRRLTRSEGKGDYRDGSVLHVYLPELRRKDGRGRREMNTEITDRDAKLIFAMALIMIPLVIDATIRLIQLGGLF